MKKTKKHPSELTADETIAHVFHPDAVKHLKEHKEHIEKKRKPLKKEGE